MNGNGNRVEVLQVTIEDITDNRAMVLDRFGNHREVRTDLLRAKGSAPAVGETWIIDRSLGFWSLAAHIGAAQADALPVPDNFADAMRLEGGYGTVKVYNGAATEEAGESEPASGQQSEPERSLWFRWRATFTGPMQFDTFGSYYDPLPAGYDQELDTVIEIFHGEATTLAELGGPMASNDDSPSPFSGVNSLVKFTPTGGNEYIIRLTGYSVDEVGWIFLNWHPDTTAASSVSSHDGTGVDSLRVVNSSNYATASGLTSIAIGMANTQAIGIQSTAIGVNCHANGDYGTIAMGANCAADGNASVALGQAATQRASGIAVGSVARALTTGAIALGEAARAGGSDYAVAIGRAAQTGSLAGDYTTLTGPNVAIGASSVALERWSVAVGYVARALTGGDGGVCIGATATVNAPYGVCIGYGSWATGDRSVAIGGDIAMASGIRDIAIGSGSRASGGSSIGLGDQAQATGQDGIAIGRLAYATSPDGIALGNQAQATGGNFCYALGAQARATGSQAVALGGGVNTTASPLASNQGCIAIGGANQAFMNGSRASGEFAVAIGPGGYYSAGAEASGQFGVALGMGSRATGINSIAIGSGDTGSATGPVAAHTNSTAIGRGAATTAANQIMLGTSAVTVVVPGTLVANIAGAAPVPPFTMAGAVSTATSGRWYAPIAFTPTTVRASLRVSGSTTTTVVLMKNGADVATVNLTSGLLTATVSYTTAAAAGDYFQVRTTAAGTGATDLTVQVY